MLQQKKPKDYVIATGKQISVRKFIEIACIKLGFEIKWKGEWFKEIGYDEKTRKELIFIDPKYFRPAEVEQLLGNPTKAKTILGWTPKTTFKELVKEMTEYDCN